MFISRLQKRLNNTSISRKLYFTIGFTALLVVVELCTLWFSITTLSAVRSYVGGEGLWSKAQKDAILNLREYAYSHQLKDYQAFQHYLQVPFGDKAARIELEKEHPDYTVVRSGLLQGRNHPEDIDGMAKLLRRFHNFYYLKKAFTAWAKAEPALDELIVIGDELHTLVKSNANKEEIAVLLSKIDALNVQITKLEDNFSLTLGEGARWLENLVLKAVLALSVTIGLTTVLIAISINRNLKRGVDAIIIGSEKIKEGDLYTRVKVFSEDEIGMVANAFNEMTKTLEQNIKELTRTEEIMIREKHRAEKSEHAKQQFLINMSHEMRTPLNAILGFARHLQQAVLGKDEQESLRMIVESGDHLLITVNDILDFTNIETGEISFVSNPLEVSSAIKSTVQLVAHNACLKGIQLEYEVDSEIPTVLYGDGPRLSQILLSLLSNALKFTEEGSILITANLFERNNEKITVEFRIKDTGIGIAKDKQEKIFDLFEQASNHMTRKFGGTGIGLTIVKHLVALQHGEISVNSHPGEGSEFCFRLPFLFKEDKLRVSTNPLLPSRSNAQSSEYGRGIKVLIAEDNAINQLLVLKLLQRHNYQTTVAENGRVALDKYQQEDFDIILMDLQMPEMDGYEATINIRNLGSDKNNVPIMAMTAHTITGDYEKCMAIGINDYISKPFHPDELYEKIRLLVPHTT
jgi:signal transduction histidine kinase/CheY-like chemotaxis protein